MAYDYNRILNALKTISSLCKKAGSCEVCPLRSESGYCMALKRAPREWEIVDTTVPRLLS